MSIVTKDEFKEMTKQQRIDYCDWCFGSDYGNCNYCEIHKQLKTP